MLVPSLYPLRFRPILQQYLWGGRKLGLVLGKHIGPNGNWAESWEVCDHGPDQSIVEFGPLEGITLGQLVVRRAARTCWAGITHSRVFRCC